MNRGRGRQCATPRKGFPYHRPAAACTQRIWWVLVGWAPETHHTWNRIVFGRWWIGWDEECEFCGSSLWWWLVRESPCGRASELRASDRFVPIWKAEPLRFATEVPARGLGHLTQLISFVGCCRQKRIRKHSATAKSGSSFFSCALRCALVSRLRVRAQMDGRIAAPDSIIWKLPDFKKLGPWKKSCLNWISCQPIPCRGPRHNAGDNPDHLSMLTSCFDPSISRNSDFQLDVNAERAQAYTMGKATMLCLALLPVPLPKAGNLRPMT